MTYREAAYQVLNSIKKNFADTDVTIPQIIYWIQVTANKYLSIKLKKDDSGSYLSRFESVPVLLDGTRQYIEIPTPILYIDKDSGIETISYNFDTGTCKRPGFTWYNFDRTTVKKSNHLYHSKYQKPSPKQPFFYTVRVLDQTTQMWVLRCYFLGTEQVHIEDVELTVHAALDIFTLKNIDEQIPVPSEWEYDLISSVLQLGRWILMIPEERKNIGEDAASASSNYIPAAPSQNQAAQAAQAANYGSPQSQVE